MGDHCRRENARAVDDAPEVDADYGLPVFQWAEDRAARLDAGIVHQHMHVSEALLRDTRQSHEVVRPRHVGFDRRDIAGAARSDLRDLGRRRVQSLAAEIGEHNLHSKAGEAPRRGKADAGGGAGHDGDVVLGYGGVGQHGFDSAWNGSGRHRVCAPASP